MRREEVINFLKQCRPELTESDWKEADLITVLSWALPTYKNWSDKGLLDASFDQPHLLGGIENG